MKKVLIITYYFPPLGGAGIQRILKFIKHHRDIQNERKKGLHFHDASNEGNTVSRTPTSFNNIVSKKFAVKKLFYYASRFI